MHARTVVAVLAAAAPLVSAAADEPTSTTAVVVTGTRVETPAFEVPASIDRIAGAQVRADRVGVNLSESLAGVAGLQARDRQNFAQDVQVSVRGFGARSTFGIRGVRLYVDGIPATLPDGQGQLSHIDLASIARFEVLRGPFSALYGNSSGGVINAISETGQGPPSVRPSFVVGSDGLRRAGAVVSGSEGALRYLASTSHFKSDGWRHHSGAERQLANVRLDWSTAAGTGTGTQLGLVANRVELARAQDPLGLNRAQLEADPRGVDPVAEAFDTRKTMSQSQVGLRAEQRLGSLGRVQLMLYAGQRETEQFQAIPVATQANALHPGGVIQLDRDYRGTDLRWLLPLGGSASLVAGLAHDHLAEHRVGRQNFVGSDWGVAGALRRDEANRVTGFDQYLQFGWKPHDWLSVEAGLRHSRVRFASADRFVTGTNPDDSGATGFGATLPVLGISLAPLPALRVYASIGRGFETPTLNELAYQADGRSGLNLALRAAKSRNGEAGVKWRPAGWGEMALAWFTVRTREEIVTLSNVGGRATFTNAGATTRRGWEASWAAAPHADLHLRAALSSIDARYDEAFATCAATPCSRPTVVVPAGNRIPGVARHTFAGSVAWKPVSGWRASAELRASGQVDVNDLNSDHAAGHAVAAFSAGHAFMFKGGELSLFARVDNALGKQYVGSVIVNEGNGRYYEPGLPRNWSAGVNAAVAF